VYAVPALSFCTTNVCEMASEVSSTGEGLSASVETGTPTVGGTEFA
jgi:succinyl-CoA synthetase alpha subunit